MNATGEPLTTAPAPAPYPVRFDVDYPEEQSRWKAIFRLILVIPALIFWYFVFYIAIIALFPMWIAVLVRGRAPRWLFDFQVGTNRFGTRLQSYFSLLTDEYPAFDDPSAIHYDVVFPDRVSRWKVLVWKLFTSIPQWLVVSVLQYAAFAIVAVGWICIVFSKKFPKGLHSFVVGTMRWRERVYAYTISLSDEYPPYSLSADATATTGRGLVASSAVGVLGVGALVAGIVALIIASPFGGEDVVEVSYARLTSGDLARGEAVLSDGEWDLELLAASDPADEGGGLFAAQPGYRFVQFSLLLTRSATRANYWGARSVELSDADDDSRPPLLAVVDRQAPPILVHSDETVDLNLVFEVPLSVQPEELIFDRGGFLSDTAVFRFY